MTGMSIKQKGTTLDALADRLKKLKHVEVAVGYPKENQGASYPDGTPVEEVAAAQVYGVGVIQRDFMALARVSIIENAKPLMAAIAKVITSNNVNKTAIANLFDGVVNMGIDEIQKAIVEGNWEPNSDRPMREMLRMRVEESWGVEIPPGYELPGSEAEV